MRRFSYERPGTLAEATRLLAEVGDEARVLAGGTDLVVGLRDGSTRPSLVVDLKWVEEFGGDSIRCADGVITFGALATMAQIERHQQVLAELPALAEAARVVGSVQIRNRATLAGNICNGSPAADTAPPQLVYGARVVVSGPEGERRVAIDDFILGPRKVDLARGELVSAIEIPLPPDGLRRGLHAAGAPPRHRPGLGHHVRLRRQRRRLPVGLRKRGTARLPGA